MEITREQASNFWNYSTLTGNLEFQFYASFPRIFNDTEETIEMNHRLFRDDQEIRKMAQHIGRIVNQLNLPEDGANNKYVGVMEAARALVHYIQDQHGNPSYNNPGSFWLICCHIAKSVE